MHVHTGLSLPRGLRDRPRAHLENTSFLPPSPHLDCSLKPLPCLPTRHRPSPDPNDSILIPSRQELNPNKGHEYSHRAAQKPKTQLLRAHRVHLGDRGGKNDPLGLFCTHLQAAEHMANTSLHFYYKCLGSSVPMNVTGCKAFLLRKDGFILLLSFSVLKCSICRERWLRARAVEPDSLGSTAGSATH